MKIKVRASAIFVILASVLANGCEFIALFWLSAAVHESGHLLAAKIERKRVERIEIGFSGARIGISDGLLGYGEEFFIAFMGPFFNFLAAFAVVLIFWSGEMTVESVIESGLRFLENGGGDRVEKAGFFALSSLAQAFLNLLPIKSLDGGRMLNSLLSAVLGEGAGERVTETCTVIVAFLSWMTAVYLMIKFSAGIALFAFAFWVIFKF